MMDEPAATVQKYLSSPDRLRSDYDEGLIDWLPPHDGPRVYEEEVHENYFALLKAAAEAATLSAEKKAENGRKNYEIVDWLTQNFPVDEESLKTIFVAAAGSRWASVDVLKLFKDRFGDVPFGFWTAFVRAIINNKNTTCSWLQKLVHPTGSELARLHGALRRKSDQEVGGQKRSAQTASAWLRGQFTPPK